MFNCYLYLNFEVIKKTDSSRYGNGDDKRLVNLGLLVLVSIFRLSTSGGKHLEDVSHGYIVSLMYKLITSAKDSDDLFIGFDWDRWDELALNKNTKCKHHLRIMLEDVFGFAEHQKKATYGLGYKLTLTKTKDDAVIDKAAGIDDARIKIDLIHWFVSQYIPSIQQQGILSKQILCKTLTEVRYIEGSVFMKEVNNQNLWNFEVGSQENKKVPIWIIIGFQERALQDSENLNSDNICRLPVTSAPAFTGTEKYPDAGILLNYDDDDDYSQSYHQIKEAPKAITKDDILKPYISDHDFRSSNARADDVGYNLYGFDKRYLQKFTASQPIKVEFKFDGVVLNDTNGFALVSTNKLVSISSDSQGDFDLTWAK